jgi:N-dimethylarginine dimethylaminohydrolase
MGHGFRSQLAAAAELQALFNKTVVPLQLVDDRFYHLDTRFCPAAERLCHGHAVGLYH